MNLKQYFKSYIEPPPEYYIITNTIKWSYVHNKSTPEEEWKHRWGAVRAAWKEYNRINLMKIQNNWMHEDDPELVLKTCFQKSQ